MLFLLLDLLRHNLEFKGAEFFDNYYLEIFPLSKGKEKTELSESLGVLKLLM